MRLPYDSKTQIEFTTKSLNTGTNGGYNLVCTVIIQPFFPVRQSNTHSFAQTVKNMRAPVQFRNLLLKPSVIDYI